MYEEDWNLMCMTEKCCLFELCNIDKSELGNCSYSFSSFLRLFISLSLSISVLFSFFFSVKAIAKHNGYEMQFPGEDFDLQIKCLGQSRVSN